MEKERENKEQGVCLKKSTSECARCDYFGCPYLTKNEKTTAYHYEEWQAGLL